ncbi:MAG: hypothetical protein IPJ08_25125 [Burkholderiales bacterium]|nr:hypothetical protein [Burkholderiales bacterium]
MSRIEQGGTPMGLLVRTAEPIDWRRTSVELTRAQAQTLLPLPANGTHVIRAAFADPTAPLANDESVTVLLDVGEDVSGWRIQTRSLPSTNAPANPDGTVLFNADLNSDQLAEVPQVARIWQPALVDLTELATANARGGIGKASWITNRGVLRQDGDYLVTDTSVALPARQGTYAVFATADWREVRIVARVSANAIGAVGVVLRFQDADNHYRFAFDGTRKVCELTKRVNGVTSALHSQRFPLALGRPYEVAFEVLGSRLRVTVDGKQIAEVFDSDLARGSVGFYSWDRSSARFERVTVASLARTLGPWAIHDHGGIGISSNWQVARRTLRQNATLFAVAPSGARLDDSGSAAVIGDAAWADVRVAAAFEAPASGAVGVVFRWQDADNHYRLLFDDVAGQRRLVRRANGVSTVLWTAAAQTTSMELVVEAIGKRLRAWVDAALLFDIQDGTLASGRAGVLALDGVAATWSAFEVRHVLPKWEDWHQFGAALGWRAAGRRLRVFAGRVADAALAAGAGEEHLFQGAASATFRPRLNGPGVDIRVVDTTGQERHLRRFLPDAAYGGVPSARVLRAADGTGMLVFVPGAGPAGTELAAAEYCLRFTYRRDNTTADATSLVLSQAGDTSDELAFVNVPWTVSS